MKRILLFLVAAVLSTAAQQPQGTPQSNVHERANTPTYSDVQCAGFLRQQLLPRTNFVAAGLHSPNGTQYAQGDTIFIQGGGLQEGAVLRVVREVRDVNRNEAFPGQHAALGAAGQPYADLARVRVIGMRRDTAIARIEFSCAPVVAGDLAVANEERAVPTLRTSPLERFPAETTADGVGKIILAKDFDTVLGTGQKIYLNLGSDKGVRTGSYFRIVRYYAPDQMESVDRLSYNAPPSEDTQARQMKVSKGDYRRLPRRTVGEAIVLESSPGSATAMITSALEDVMVGDQVEADSGPSSAAR